jgi:hypothetical protein
MKNLATLVSVQRSLTSGANLTTSEFTSTYNASVVLGYDIISKKMKIFLSSKRTRLPLVAFKFFYNAGIVTNDRRINLGK